MSGTLVLVLIDSTLHWMAGDGSGSLLFTDRLSCEWVSCTTRVTQYILFATQDICVPDVRWLALSLFPGRYFDRVISAILWSRFKKPSVSCWKSRSSAGGTCWRPLLSSAVFCSTSGALGIYSWDTDRKVSIGKVLTRYSPWGASRKAAVVIGSSVATPSKRVCVFGTMF